MVDIVSPEKRSRMMSGIRSKNTRPEVFVRRSLHRVGFRFRLHCPNLPGKPDLVFPKYNAVIFIQGCFWHCHDCALFKWPSSRQDFWKTKINRNKQKDKESLEKLLNEGWRVMLIWECALKGSGKISSDKVIAKTIQFVTGKRKFVEVRGHK